MYRTIVQDKKYYERNNYPGKYIPQDNLHLFDMAFPENKG